MSDKLRSVNTKFWDDTFISELSPNEKLLKLMDRIDIRQKKNLKRLLKWKQ